MYAYLPRVLPFAQFYSGGIYSQPFCSSTELTHSLLVVGYGTLNGKNYWLLKNRYAGRGMQRYAELCKDMQRYADTVMSISIGAYTSEAANRMIPV